jgi:hypothetical protein
MTRRRHPRKAVENVAPEVAQGSLTIQVVHLNGTLTLEEVDAIRERLASHPAREAAERWLGIRSTVAVLLGNGAELRDYIQRVETAAKPLSPGSAEAEVFYLMVLRLLLNYVSSAGTLIDHTRNLLRPYRGQKFWVEYEARKDAVAAAPVSGFIGGLRNYMLHRKHPLLAGGFSASNSGQPTLEVLLDSAEMLAWDKCPANAKPYLLAHPLVRVLRAVEEHERTITGLYKWLLDEYHALHGSEVEDFNALVRHRDAAYGPPVAEFQLEPGDEPWSLRWSKDLATGGQGTPAAQGG